jgi:hypothetical protein
LHTKDRLEQLSHFVRRVQMEMVGRFGAAAELAPSEGGILRAHFRNGRNSVAAAAEIVRARRRPEQQA